MSIEAYMGRPSGFACWYKMAGKTLGRMILVAMITMGAPQTGQRCRTWFSVVNKAVPGRDSKHHLQEVDEFLAA